VNPRFEPEDSEITDARLLQDLKRGEASGLDMLVERYWTALVSYAARLQGDWDGAQDVAQEAFVRLWELRERWTEQGSVRALLYKIARHVALDDQKRLATRARLLEERAVPGALRTPADELGEAQLQEAFEHAVAGLPERRREVFLLARFDGLTHRQIAVVMGISPQTVANQLSAALADLRDRLGGYLNQPDSSDPIFKRPPRQPR